MNNFLNGATIWSRSTSDSKIFTDKPDKWFKIWYYLVEKAKFNNDSDYPCGSNYMRYDWIMEKTKASKDQIAKFIKWAKDERMLATTKATHGFIYSLLNYADYQNLDNYKSNSKSNSKATQKQHESSNIIKNDKELKNDKEEKIYKKEKSDLHIRILKECSNLGIDFKSTPETFAVYENRYSEVDIVRKAQDACVWLISKNLKELTIARLGKFLSDCKGKEQPKQHRTAADYEREFLLRTQTKNANTRNPLPQTA